MYIKRERVHEHLQMNALYDTYRDKVGIHFEI